MPVYYELGHTRVCSKMLYCGTGRAELGAAALSDIAQDGEGAAVRAEPSEAAQRLAWLPATAAAVSLRLAAFDAAVTYVPGLPPARDTLQVGLTAQYMLHRDTATAFTTLADAVVSLLVLPEPLVLHDAIRMSEITYGWVASLSTE